MGLKISFKHPFGKHSLLHGLGKVAQKAAPFAGLIPGVGPIAAGVLGAGGAAVSGGNVIKGALGGAAGGLASGALGKLNLKSDFLKKIGSFITRPGMLGTQEGKLDLGKLMGVATTGMGIMGARAQRRSQENYFNGSTDIRNKLLSRVLAPQQNNYNMSQ